MACSRYRTLGVDSAVVALARGEALFLQRDGDVVGARGRRLDDAHDEGRSVEAFHGDPRRSQARAHVVEALHQEVAASGSCC